MRVLYLTTGCFDKGGISRYSRYQITALREICGTGNVRVLSLLGPNKDGFEEPFAVDWHGRSRNNRPSNGDRIALSARFLWNVTEWRPDVVHGAHVHFGPLLTIARRMRRATRTVLNVYGHEIWSGLTAQRRAHLARTERVIADCHFTGRYVQSEGLNPRAPTVIWDCVDLQRFRPGRVSPEILAKYGIPDPSEHLIVMSLGRLSKGALHKGFDRLIEVVATLAGEVPALRLVIAGDGDDRARLEGLASSRGIRERVSFTGWVHEKDLAAVYRAASIFSLVSDRGHGRGEGIPLTPLEAMACGAAVIVGDEDGSQEAVFDQRNGFVVSPRDQSQHRSVLLALAKEPHRLERARTEARRVAEEQFGYSAFVAKHRSFLDDLAPSARAVNSIEAIAS